MMTTSFLYNHKLQPLEKVFCCAVYSKSEKCVIQYTYKIAVFIKTCMAYGEFARKFVFLL